MLSPDLIATALPPAAEKATRLRHHLHTIPELMYEEHQTADMIRHELDELEIPWIPGPATAPTATFAHIGDPSLPCIALRADIDALPIEELNDLPYRSTHPGRMHACGHDGHTSALLGATSILKALEKDLPICVKLIFQPAEENGGGAGRLVEAGILDGRIGPKPQAIFGLHGWPALPVGKIASKPGAIMAAVDNFSATFQGKGAHGAFPHLGRDPIVAAAEAVLSLQQIVSREVNPIDSAVVTVGKITGGTTTNIIPATATIEGTARTLSPDTRQHVEQSIRRRISAIAAANDMTSEFRWFENYPATINDPAMVDYARGVVQKTFGPDAYLTAPYPSMGGEDFAFYLEKVPGCFLIIGLCPPGVDQCPGLHHPNFNFNDAALPIAIRLLVELAVGNRVRS